MPLTTKSVLHISALARIELTPEEETKFADELSAILEFVAKLNEADTSRISPMLGGTTLENVLRPDVQLEKVLEGGATELLNLAPEKKEGWVKVKEVFS